MDSRIDLNRIARVIAQTDPDLVALQEVDRSCHRSGGRDMPKELGHMLEMDRRLGKIHGFRGRRIRDGRALAPPLPDGAKPRCALEVQVQTDGFPTHLSPFCIHNDWTEEEFRVRQTKALLDSLKEHRAPIILVQ
jgi:endonuclease/exonuclease/phosphatase family metal-dependent hydrolase